jgi:hypothetical protein
VQYYSLSSQQGEIEADMALSKIFLRGAEDSFEKDEVLAFTFAEKGARKGLPSAEFAMGYYAEVGVVDMARKWYSRVHLYTCLFSFLADESRWLLNTATRMLLTGWLLSTNLHHKPSPVKNTIPLPRTNSSVNVPKLNNAPTTPLVAPRLLDSKQACQFLNCNITNRKPRHLRCPHSTQQIRRCQ